MTAKSMFRADEGRRMRILVADDDPLARMLLQSAVESLGHECIVAADGDQAWKLFLDLGPEVLITDRVMPGIDGLELCRRIRAQESTGYTYVILSTSLIERSDVLHGMEAGADDYLTKPLDHLALESRLVAARRVTSLHAELHRYRCELIDRASTDPLTELRNRRSLDVDLSALHATCIRHGRSYCLAMCDVDLFKAYNDAFGHPAGDEALRAVAATLSQQARKGDTVYRYGGEEFLLLLPEQDLTAGAAAAERFRRSVEELDMPDPAGTPARGVTLSIGMAVFIPTEGTTTEALLAQADAALYKAKASGRNRVVVASSTDRA